MLGLAIIVLVACGSLTESKVLGKWTNSDSGSSIEFLKDGTVQFGDVESRVAGTWNVLSDGRVNIEILRGAHSFVGILQDDATLALEVAGVAGATFQKQ